jgi:MprA protease rhombosortase-interaction domain-containing protein
MKLRKAFSVIVAVAMFATLAVGASAAYTAELLGQMNTDISDLVGEWDFENVPGNGVSFEMGEEFTLKFSFDEPVAFSGNWVGIETGIPVADDDEAGAIPVAISIKADGVVLSGSAPDQINRDNSGTMTIDLARKWGGDYDHFGLSDLAFSELEITLTIGEPTATPEPVVTTAAPVVAGDTTVASDAQKDGADTGIAGVAMISAAALVAAGAVAFTRKRK